MTNPPMPANEAQPALGTTPFPDRLLDRLMPRLRDTEWRLLCVVVRQTFGWSVSEGRTKQADWLSHSQLRRKTGRSSAALSLAIDFLCRNDLIAVQDDQGQPLISAAERRRHRGRLYFRLNPLILTAEPGPIRFKKRIQKPGITINTHNNKAVVLTKNQHGRSSKTGNQKTNRVQRKWEQVGKELRAKRHKPRGHG